MLFREQQRLTQWWMWAVIALIVVLQWWNFIQQIVLGHPVGDHPAPNSLVMLFHLLFGIALPLMLWTCVLITEVRSDALYVRYVPFHLRPRRFDYGDILSATAVRYSPLLDYGGWGIRFSRGGMAYNATGNLGVRLEFAGGRHLLIGSRFPNELATAITQAMHRGAAAPV